MRYHARYAWAPCDGSVKHHCPHGAAVVTAPDAAVYDVECVLLATLLVALCLTRVIAILGRARPEWSVGLPMAVGLVVRLVAAAGVSLTGVGLSLRGGDEVGFVRSAREVATSGFDSGVWIPGEAHRLHEIVFALQIKLADFPEAALRVTQIGISMVGIVLIVAAIHDLAGAHAGRLGAWILALEPASIFFNSFLHREPLLVLASGLIVFGGTKIWAKLELRGVLTVALGCATALATRPYAAWFLATGGLLLIAHASIRGVGVKLRAVPLIYAVAIAIVAATPAVLALTSQDSLKQNLQGSQDANTDPTARRGDAASNNLGLERVDFSTRSGLVTNLPRRVRDVVLRPYPWQVQNTSQQLGAIGTLVVLLALGLLFRYVRRNWGRVVTLTAPILYPALCLLMAYALSVGNAGTGFRYRTHLVLLGLAALVILREHALRSSPPGSDGELRPSTARAAAVMGPSKQLPKALSR